jgi:diaminohydroxyphosphoribosylaminopyrimidine deaminase/5-amino-6-(5-phosphoribosylamino)uracil reductase
MMVGTSTIEIDNPLLTVRDVDGVLDGVQPLRAVVGLRDLPAESRVFNADAETVQLRTRDPREALEQLFARDRQHVFLEGGATLAAAFLEAGLVDEIVTYVAPMLLGSGRSVVADLGIPTISEAHHLEVTDVTVLAPETVGDDTNIRITMKPLVEPVETISRGDN